MLGYPSKSVVALASFCLFSLGVASGQQPLIPADGDYVHFGTDSVNLQNFAIGLSVTVTDKQGLIPFKYTLEGTNECFGAVNGASHSAVCGFMNVANGAHNCLIKNCLFLPGNSGIWVCAQLNNHDYRNVRRGRRILH